MTASTEGETPSMETQSPSNGSAADLPMSTQESDTPLEPNPSTQQLPDATLQPTNGAETGQKRKREDENPKTANGLDPDPKSRGSVHPLYKTSLCSYFRRHSASCSHGETCRFAHSEEELQPRPDGSWDPTSERAKKLLKRETEDKDEEGEGQEEEESVMMTEVLAESGDPQLSKCLIHLPRKWNSDQLKTFLDEQARLWTVTANVWIEENGGEKGVTFKAAKKKKGMVVGFITFEAAEHVKSTTEVLEGKTFGNNKLKVGDVIPRSYDDKIKLAQKKYQTVESGAVEPAEASAVLSDHGNTDSSGSNGKSACDVVTPLAHMPYAEQLEQKKNSLLQLLKRLVSCVQPCYLSVGLFNIMMPVFIGGALDEPFLLLQTRNARKACPKGVSLPEWVVKSREIGGLPCELEGIIESPLINGYRNKCEFSVGYSVQGKPTVGFMLGNFREGVTAVEEPVDCPNVSMIACKYALIFQEFLQNSALPIWNRFNNIGFWRQLTVREGRRPQEDTSGRSDETNIAEVMLMVQVCTTGYDDDVINSEIERMTQAFAAGAASTSPPLPLTALLLQNNRS
ncbi:hypothetical protein Cgig2_009736 [Carnegiea gigantea]|uniref:C3H1-type domain-containing protein n=1 Tax=Carnegiea gigantea TaxID=171969 RepID=A0A9Q1K0A0_9CARY|nr:hypothetical protein Cgig2_009736 [Carnegiea gigantea]